MAVYYYRGVVVSCSSRVVNCARARRTVRCVPSVSVNGRCEGSGGLNGGVHAVLAVHDIPDAGVNGRWDVSVNGRCKRRWDCRCERMRARGGWVNGSVQGGVNGVCRVV